MKSHEALRRCCKKVGAKKVAAGMKVSLGIVHKWSRPGGAAGSGIVNPLDRAGQLLRVTQDRDLAQWLCGELDGFYVAHRPAKARRGAALPPQLHRVLRGLAQLQLLLAESLPDGQSLRAQAAGLRQWWEELKSDMEWCVQLCEQVNPLRSLGLAWRLEPALARV